MVSEQDTIRSACISLFIEKNQRVGANTDMAKQEARWRNQRMDTWPWIHGRIYSKTSLQEEEERH